MVNICIDKTIQRAVSFTDVMWPVQRAGNGYFASSFQFHLHGVLHVT